MAFTEPFGGDARIETLARAMCRADMKILGTRLTFTEYDLFVGPNAGQHRETEARQEYYMMAVRFLACYDALSSLAALSSGSYGLLSGKGERT